MNIPNWNKEEFLAYVLIFASHCNEIEDSKEVAYILKKINSKTFHKIHTEVVVDSEQKGLRKIEQFLRENKFSQNDKDCLLKDVKNVLFADGCVDIKEKKMFAQLKKMIW